MVTKGLQIYMYMSFLKFAWLFLQSYHPHPLYCRKSGIILLRFHDKPSFNIFVIYRQAVVAICIHNYHASHIITVLHRELPCCIQNYLAAYSITVLHTELPCCINNYHAVYRITMLHTELPCCIQNYLSAYSITVLHRELPCCIYNYHATYRITCCIQYYRVA